MGIPDITVLEQPMHAWPSVIPTTWEPSGAASLSNIGALADLLVSQGYTLLSLDSAHSLDAHLRCHIERLNARQVSDSEWQRIYSTIIHPANPLSHGDTIDQALTRYYSTDSHNFIGDDGEQHTVILADRFQLHRNVLELLPHHDTQRLTIFLNGFPLLHLAILPTVSPLEEVVPTLTPESLSEDLWGSPLARFLTVRVATNGNDTRYYSATTWPFSLSCLRVADTHEAEISPVAHLTHWTDAHHARISNIVDFARTFLRPDALVRILTWYCLATPYGSTLVMRPHQIHAVEQIIRSVLRGTRKGTMWHAPGTGRTTTAHLAASVLSRMPHIDHVVIVVDDEHASIPNRALLVPHSEDAYSAESGILNLFNLIQNGPALPQSAQGLIPRDSAAPVRTTVVPARVLAMITQGEEHYDQLINEYAKKIRSRTCERKIVFISDNCVATPLNEGKPSFNELFQAAFSFELTSTLEQHDSQCVARLSVDDAISSGYINACEYSHIVPKTLPVAQRAPSLPRLILSDLTKGFVSAKERPDRGRNARIASHIYHLLTDQKPATDDSQDSTHSARDLGPTPCAILYVDSTDAATHYHSLLTKRLTVDDRFNAVVVLDHALQDQEDEAGRDWPRTLVGPAPQETYTDDFPHWSHFNEYLRLALDKGFINLIIAVNRCFSGIHSPRLTHVFADCVLDAAQLCNALSLAGRRFPWPSSRGSFTSFVHQPYLSQLEETTARTLVTPAHTGGSSSLVPSVQNGEISDTACRMPASTSEAIQGHLYESLHPAYPTLNRGYGFIGRSIKGHLRHLDSDEQVALQAIRWGKEADLKASRDLLRARFSRIYHFSFSASYDDHNVTIALAENPPKHSDGTPFGPTFNVDLPSSRQRWHALFGRTTGHGERGFSPWYDCTVPWSAVSAPRLTISNAFDPASGSSRRDILRTIPVEFADLPLSSTWAFRSEWFDDI